jgi:chloramphenicol 3-O phosphotransferase
MTPSDELGQIVVLNGPPRSGKSSIVEAIQAAFDGLWVNLGVDVSRRMTPERLQPGIGLRPGEVTHTAAPFVPVLYTALYHSIAAHSRLGVNVAVDVGHYDAEILTHAARRLLGLPVLFVGVHCPLEVIMERRRAAGPERYAVAAEGKQIPEPVLAWQEAVHGGWPYDLEVDTSRLSPEECAAAIRVRLDAEPAPSAFGQLASSGKGSKR